MFLQGLFSEVQVPGGHMPGSREALSFNETSLSYATKVSLDGRRTKMARGTSLGWRQEERVTGQRVSALCSGAFTPV